MKLTDKIIVIGVIVLILGTVLAIGAVHPWSYSIAEAVIFGLLAVALAKIARMKLGFAQLRHSPAFSLMIPLVLFVGFVLCQLLPLPAMVERLVSPNTYDIYLRAFPGWSLHTASSPVATPGAGPGWLPVSIAPTLTETMLLKVVAYSGFFVLVLLYPFGAGSGNEIVEERFYRVIYVAIVASATLIAAVGLVEAATWNGKILWLVTPYDWGRMRPQSLTRLIGPFVNPDHFANYLVLGFPLALSGALFDSSLARRTRDSGFRILCSVAALIIAAGIFGSLSRAGWFGALLGPLVLVGICAKGHRPLFLFGKSLGPRLVIACLASLLLLLFASSMFLTGSSRTNQADLRLAESTSEFENVSPGARLAIWKDSTGMVRDFPLFGVGLGCWPELYPHYRRPPWLNQFTMAVHNDYLQLLAETGVIGALLLGWFLGAAAIKLYKGLKTLPASRLPIYAALMAALSTMAVHELFDFNLQIPANALLFILILGIALRMAGVGKLLWARAKEWSWTGVAITGLLWALSVVLIFLCLTQDKVPYPYNVTRPNSLVQARALMRSHPANSRVHLWTAELLRPANDNGSPARRQQELRNAIWLEPTNPFARDLYANALFRNHDAALGLTEVSVSMFAAPSLDYHAYSVSGRLVSLPEAVQKAVERGIKGAVRRHFEGSVASLALFYDELGRFAEEGELLENVDCGLVRMDLGPGQCLVLAGSAYSKAKDLEGAERALHRAIQLDPGNAQAYQSMITLVFAPRHDLRSAKDLVHTGIANGADSYPLYLALSRAADASKDRVAAEAALSKAAELRPDFQTFEALGLRYLDDNNVNRATFFLKRASEMNPGSAQAAFYLGVAEQSNYEYASAERAYAHAVALDPKNVDYRTTLELLKRKVADNMPQAQP